MAMKLSTLASKARKGDLEVEDLLAIARERPDGLTTLLAQLQQELGWQDDEQDSHTVPWSRWVTVAAAYADAGLPGLKALAARADNLRFILGMLEADGSADAVRFILMEFAHTLKKPETDLQSALQLAGSLNLLLSFKGAPQMNDGEARTIQKFLLTLHPLLSDANAQATALLALRGVGDAEALAFAEAQADLPYPWESSRKTVCKAIRLRLRARATT